MTNGVPAAQLDDATLERELRHLHQTRSDTFFEGSPAALNTHTRRMLELENEYLERHPDLAPHVLRLRATNRAVAGQD